MTALHVRWVEIGRGGDLVGFVGFGWVAGLGRVGLGVQERR